MLVWFFTFCVAQSCTSKATPHMGSSHSGPAAAASWKPEATPDSTACSMDASAVGSIASAAEPAGYRIGLRAKAMKSSWRNYGYTFRRTCCCAEATFCTTRECGMLTRQVGCGWGGALRQCSETKCKVMMRPHLSQRRPR